MFSAPTLWPSSYATFLPLIDSSCPYAMQVRAATPKFPHFRL